MAPTVTAYEEKLLGTTDFSTPEAQKKLVCFRFQQLIANHILFKKLMSYEELSDLADNLTFDVFDPEDTRRFVRKFGLAQDGKYE